MYANPPFKGGAEARAVLTARCRTGRWPIVRRWSKHGGGSIVRRAVAPYLDDAGSTLGSPT
ncbi:MAG: hypothetical protein ACLSVD_04905 [Eggerthellaceae bacterium]